MPCYIVTFPGNLNTYVTGGLEKRMVVFTQNACLAISAWAIVNKIIQPRIQSDRLGCWQRPSHTE
jgi:hypothetical protein